MDSPLSPQDIFTFVCAHGTHGHKVVFNYSHTGALQLDEIIDIGAAQLFGVSHNALIITDFFHILSCYSGGFIAPAGTDEVHHIGNFRVIKTPSEGWHGDIGRRRWRRGQGAAFQDNGDDSCGVVRNGDWVTLQFGEETFIARPVGLMAGGQLST